jgi:hypothetical protein
MKSRFVTQISGCSVCNMWFTGQFRIWARICVRKEWDSSTNQAQCVGDFMRQKWQIYDLSYSYMLSIAAKKLPHGILTFTNICKSFHYKEIIWSFVPRNKCVPTNDRISGQLKLTAQEVIR